MVNLISTISKGTRMDQIYLPKVRPPGFSLGAAVEISPALKPKKSFFTYNLPRLAPWKSLIVNEILAYFEQLDNVIITGSFLREGFQFNDVDIVLVTELAVDENWSEHFKETLGINAQIIGLPRPALLQGLQQDPLFQMMLSSYLAKKREIFRYKNKFSYQLLDLHLLKSKTLMDSFEILTGREKYNLVRNLLALRLFLAGKRLTHERVEKEMEKAFGKGTVQKLRENLVSPQEFLKPFRQLYHSTQEQILKMIKNNKNNEK